MFIPTKHENLRKSMIVLGYDIMKLLKKRKYNVENLFQELKKIHTQDISLNQYYNTLTFLWVTEIIELEDFNIKLRK